MKLKNIVFLVLFLILVLLSCIFPAHWLLLLIALVVLGIAYLLTSRRFWKWQEKRVDEDEELGLHEGRH